MSITVAASKVPMVKESESAKVTTSKDSEAKNNAIPFVSEEKLQGSGDSVELSKTLNPAPQEEKGFFKQVWDGVKTLYKGVTGQLDSGEKMTTAEKIDDILGTRFSLIVDGQKHLKTGVDNRAMKLEGSQMSDVYNRVVNSVMTDDAMKLEDQMIDLDKWAPINRVEIMMKNGAMEFVDAKMQGNNARTQAMPYVR